MRTSVLFSYKVARNLMQLSGDVHSTPSMGVTTHILFGVLDEKYFPYKDEDAEMEPTAFQYFLAQNYKAELGKLED